MPLTPRLQYFLQNHWAVGHQPVNAKIKQSAHLLRLIHRPDVCLHSARFHCLHKVVVYDLDAVPCHRHLSTCRP